jgi:fibronectin-binding autotransporter adhesin
MMKRFAARLFSFSLVAALLLVGPLSSVRAAISITGDVNPSDSAAWGNNTTGYVGNTSAGTLTATGGMLLTYDAYIGYGSTASGTVIISGAKWTRTAGDPFLHSLYVGYSGGATLTIANGGTVDNFYGYIGSDSGSAGTVTVAGTGSAWDSTHLSVGCSGNGTVSISGGGSVGSQSAYVGLDSGSSGTVMASDSGSTLNYTSDLCVGYSGRGVMNLTHGAMLTTTVYSDAYVGYNSGASGTITVADAASGWKDAWDVYIGYYGSGELKITGGGTVSSRPFDGFNRCGNVIACYSGSKGTVTVDGAGSRWTNYGLEVGLYGSGTLSVTNGGAVVSAAGSGYLGEFSGGTGLATVDGAGSLWSISQCLYVGGSGSGTLSIGHGGSVSVADATFVAYSAGSTGAIRFGPGGGTLATRSLRASLNQLTGTGTINAKGLVSDVSLTFDGTAVAAGTFGTTGTITVDMSATSGNGDLGAGYMGTSTLMVENGAKVYSAFGYIGTNAGSSGTATVEGTDSKWTTGSILYVGNSGAGALVIRRGGTVSSYSIGRIAYSSGSRGAVTVDGAGSVWNSGDLYVGDRGAGALTISNGGAGTSTVVYIGYGSGGTGTVTVGGSGSKWTSASSLNVGYGSGSMGIATVNGAGSTWISGGTLCVGYSGTGTLAISGGGAVSSTGSYCLIGARAGSKGVVNVSGAESSLTCSAQISIGASVSGYGNGTLNIIDSGSVISGLSYIGLGTGAVTVDGSGSRWTAGDLFVGSPISATLKIVNGGGVSSTAGYIATTTYGPKSVVAVDGIGSKWTNSGSLSLGPSGNAILSITGSGTVSAGTVSINNMAVLAIDVGRGSSLAVGGSSGTITNNGKIRILAGAGVAAGGPYAPISAGSWGGTGTYQAVGGTWSAGTHQFTVSDVQPATSGGSVTIDLAQRQRILVSGGPDGWSLGSSFLMKTSPSLLTFAATPISDGPLAALSSLLDPGDGVLGGWALSATGGYAAGDPAYLSFGVGSAQSLDDLLVWKYASGSWSRFDAFDLTYDQTYASFTVTGMGTYAVTGLAVPEPAALVLLGLGAVALLGYFWRRRAFRPAVICLAGFAVGRRASAHFWAVVAI